MHNPDGAEYLEKPAMLAVSGDTHCNQIDVFGLQPSKILDMFYTPKTKGAWTCGKYTLSNGTPLIVSAGAGESNIPFRLGVPARAEMMTLSYSEGPTTQPTNSPSL